MDRSKDKKPVFRLLQVETALACNLNCIFCPWGEARGHLRGSGLMKQRVWSALRPHLSKASEIDFSGGGEPFLNPRLLDWMQEAKTAKCRIGLTTNGTLLDQKKIAGLLEGGVDWIAFSMDSANKATYERIRRGASFLHVCNNIQDLAKIRKNNHPRILINTVLIPDNIFDLESLVRMAADLGADQVNFKQCDVIRNESAQRFCLIAPREHKGIGRYQKALAKAEKTARKLGLNTTAFSFTPEELPVCDQDPRHSLFIRYNGQAAPCINLAMGGEALFMGEKIDLPIVTYGALPDEDLMDLFASKHCLRYGQRFEARIRAHDRVIARSNFESSLIKLEETYDKARKAMPLPPAGCGACHYLYGV